MRREKRHERSASRKALELYGVPNLKCVPWGGENGWPDRVYFFSNGNVLFIEYKEVGEEPNVKQIYMHDMLKGLGFDVITCDTEQEALDAIKARVEQAGSQLPETGRQVPARKRSRRATSRSRNGED